MPNCFSLKRKSEPEKGVVSLPLIDKEMCEHFNKPVHETIYHAYWFEYIGFKLAMGRSFDYIKGYYTGRADSSSDKQKEVYEHLVLITEWLNNNFKSSAWAER